MSNKDKYWIAFASIENIGSKFIYSLYEYFGDIEKAWNVSRKDFAGISLHLRNSSLDDFFLKRDNTDPDICFSTIQEKNIKYITIEDDDYPYLLKQIDNPPVTLFYRGNLCDCNLDRTLAVVGSRRASENSKQILRKILLGFKDTDITIVSGMAEGIDTIAHKSSIEANVKTIAVLGSGLDKIFPQSNRRLYNEIVNGNGAVISEYWHDFDAMPFRFPMRNRIVSGLSKGTLVAEAALKSGALITANLTLEQGRELMCMPGLISNPNTEGIFKLLKQGAALVTNTEDILNVLSWEINKPTKTEVKPDNLHLSEGEQKVLDEIKLNSLSVDEIILKTNLNISDLMIILTQLELKGLIKQIDGNKYIVV